mgnify:CR=1 FL=1
MGTNIADGLIEPLHHRVVFGGLRRRRLVAILGEQPFGRRVRVMRQHRRIPGEERLTVLLRARNEIRQRRQGLTADVETLVAVASALGHAFGEATGLIGTHPPLTRLQADVALLAEEAGQDRRLLEELDHLGAPFEEGRALLFRRGGLACAFHAFDSRHTRVVTRDTVAMHVAASQHRS